MSRNAGISMTTPHECGGCPIHNWFDSTPASLPLGVPFSDRLEIREIDFDTSRRIYESHHSYTPSGRGPGTFLHHGVYLDGGIVGAISYSYPFMSADLQLGPLNIPSERFTEVSRVCIGIDMPNLASAAMSRSQDVFVEDGYADEHDTLAFISWVREDYDASMFKALGGKGWYIHGRARGHQAGNRPESDVRDMAKHRLVCPLTHPSDLIDWLSP